MTRGSTALVVHVVQPRLDAPAMPNCVSAPRPSTCSAYSETVSIALTTALVMGSRTGHSLSVGSLMNCAHVNAITASSERAFWIGSSTKTMCWFGIWKSEAPITPVAMHVFATSVMSWSVLPVNAVCSFEPPVFQTNAVSDRRRFDGTMTTIWCHQTGRLCCALVSHCWLVMFRM